MSDHADVDCTEGITGVVPDRFTLSIELGNELMTTPTHVAGALSLVADKLAAGASVSGGIRDINGNLVGQWRFQ